MKRWAAFNEASGAVADQSIDALRVMTHAELGHASRHEPHRGPATACSPRSTTTTSYRIPQAGDISEMQIQIWTAAYRWISLPAHPTDRIGGEAGDYVIRLTAGVLSH